MRLPVLLRANLDLDLDFGSHSLLLNLCACSHITSLFFLQLRPTSSHPIPTIYLRPNLIPVFHRPSSSQLPLPLQIVLLTAYRQYPRIHNTTSQLFITTTKMISVTISDDQPRDIFARTSSRGFETRKKTIIQALFVLTRGDVEAGCSIKIVDFHLCASSYFAIFVYRMFRSGCFADTVVHSVKSLPTTSRIVSSY